MKACPNCFSPIEDLDTLCRYCGVDVAPGEVPRTPAEPAAQLESKVVWGPAAAMAKHVRAGSWPLIGVGVAALLVCAIGAAFFVGEKTETQSLPSPMQRTVPQPPQHHAPAQPSPTSGSAGVATGPNATGPKWMGNTQPRWASDGSKTVSFALAAESEVPVWMKRVRPVLAVRCLSGTTEVFVLTNSAATFESDTGSHTVTVGFDGGPEVAQQWIDSDDLQTLFAPNAVALARQIAGSRQMRFAFTPFNASPVNVEFDVTGFDALLPVIAKTCRWQ